MKLRERIAVITGAGSGVGRATAELFSREGAKIVIVDIDRLNGEETRKLIKERGGEGFFLKIDVSKADQVRDMIEHTIHKFQKIDILFNNAGIIFPSRLQEISVRDWDRLMSVNLRGVFLCCKYAIPFIKKSGGGVIINTASAAGFIGSREEGAYNVSKAGVINLTKCLALECAMDNIRVNCVCPGAIDTPLLRYYKNEDIQEMKRIRQVHPIGRIAQPAEIAHAVLYLVSDEASFVTGSALVIDGGLSA